jgi:hypothetical protein
MPSTFKGTTIFIAKRNIKMTERGRVVTVTYGGNFDNLVSFAPPFSTDMGGYGGYAFFKVESYDLDKPGRGKEGTLVVTGTERLTYNGYTADPTLLLEKEWLPVEVALLKHPNFQSGGLWELSLADVKAIKTWEDASDEEIKTAAYTVLSASAKQYADRILRNQTAYNVYLPAAKRTRFYTASPTIGGCGHLENPPGEFAMPLVDGNNQPYYYIKTSDASNKQGHVHERVETWIGFLDYDANIINYA